MLLIMSTTLMSSEMLCAAAPDDRNVDQDGAQQCGCPHQLSASASLCAAVSARNSPLLRQQKASPCRQAAADTLLWQRAAADTLLWQRAAAGVPLCWRAAAGVLLCQQKIVTIASAKKCR